MPTYSGEEIQNLSNEILLTLIMNLAHNLDKTINTEIGTTKFFDTAGYESVQLEKSLGEWESRKMEDNDIILWAKSLLQDACTLNSEISFNLSSTQLNISGGKNLLSILSARRSVRKWLSEEIPKEAIDIILEAGIWAPSACNRQSSRFLVITQSEQKFTIAQVREKFLNNAPVLFLLGADKRNYFPEEIDVVPYLDVAMAAENMLLMAHQLGLGAVFVKSTSRDINWTKSGNDVQLISDFYEKLEIPEYFIPVGVIAVGFPARIPQPPCRRPISEVVFWERFFVKQEEKTSIKINGYKRKIQRTFCRVVFILAKRMHVRAYLTID